MERKDPGMTTRTATPSATAAIVESHDWSMALDILIKETMPSAGGPPPEVVLLFVSATFSEDYPAILREVRERTGAKALVGCSGAGVLANGQEVETQPAISMLVLWLPGAEIHPVRLHQERVEMLQDPATCRMVTGLDPEEVRGWIMFAEPYRLDARSVVDGLSAAYPDVPVLGGLASGGLGRRRSWVFLDEQVYDEGAVALAVTGPYRLHSALSQGCEPIGEPWTITGVEQNMMTSISGRPALDMLRQTVDALELDEDVRIPGNVLVGYPVDEYQDEFSKGDFLLRGILGIDLERRGVIVGGRPRVGQTVQFQLRDEGIAELDLQQVLVGARATLGDQWPMAAVLCTCRGRGSNVFQSPHHDATAVQAAFRDLPVAGLFCAGEIGPARGTTAIHGFTASLIMIVPE